MWAMRSRSIVAAVVVLLGASSASAQVLSLEFHDGRVRLTAENVPVSRILDEWARLGGTKIVNGERVHVYGRPELFEARGEFRLRALSVERFGLGDHLGRQRAPDSGNQDEDQEPAIGLHFRREAKAS